MWCSFWKMCFCPEWIIHAGNTKDLGGYYMIWWYISIKWNAPIYFQDDLFCCLITTSQVIEVLSERNSSFNTTLTLSQLSFDWPPFINNRSKQQLEETSVLIARAVFVYVRDVHFQWHHADPDVEINYLKQHLSKQSYKYIYLIHVFLSMAICQPSSIPVKWLYQFVLSRHLYSIFLTCFLPESMP